MFDLSFIFCLFLFSLGCFFEFFVFNEEALLALCFFCFIFFSFNSLGNSVTDIFQSRAAKFESDLLISFSMTKETTSQLFYNYFAARGFGLKFNVWSIIIIHFLRFSQEYASFTYTRSFYLVSLAKLSELFYFNGKITANFQKKSISLLLYPLIFQSVKRNLLVSAKLKRRIDPILKLQISILKSIS
jgi:hypothetical protein